MPYTCKLNGTKWELTKDADGKIIGTHSTKKSCIRQMRALYAHEISNEANLVLRDRLYPYDGDLCSHCISQADETINVVLDGIGGDTFTALSIHNQLRESGKRIRVYINYRAMSAHAIVALAGDEIYIAENGVMLFHAPMKEFQQDQLMNADEMQESIKKLRVVEEILSTTIRARTGKSEDEVKELVKKETWLTAEQALSLGLVDEVIPIMREAMIESYFPESIVNYVKGKQQMPLKDVCNRFGLSDVNDDNAEDKLVEFISSLQKNAPKPKIEPSESLVSIVCQSRDTILNALQAEGRVTSAVITDLKAKFTTKDRVKHDFQEGIENTVFDNIVDSLKKNDVVVSFGNKSGKQALDKGQEDSSKGLLKRKMEERKKAMAD